MFGKDEETEIHVIADGDVKWYSHEGKHLWWFFKMLNRITHRTQQFH